MLFQAACLQLQIPHPALLASMDRVPPCEQQAPPPPPSESAAAPQSRRSEIEQNDEESDRQLSDDEEGEAEANQDEGPYLNQGGSLACVREGMDDDDDEITDSRGDDRRQDKLKALARLTNEFNRTVKELRAEQRGKAFEFSASYREENYFTEAGI